MPNYETQYIARGASAEEVVEAFGALLTKLNAIMNNLDSGNVRRISTNQTSIRSDDGSTEFNGSQIIMYDNGGTERVNIGKDKNGSFNFILKDADGAAALTLSDSGKATFQGKITGSEIDVETDVAVGNNIYLGKEDDENKKGIYFFQAKSGNNKIQPTYITAKVNGEIEIRSPKIQFISSGGDNAFCYKIGGGNNMDIVTKGTAAYVTIDGTHYDVHWGSSANLKEEE